MSQSGGQVRRWQSTTNKLTRAAVLVVSHSTPEPDFDLAAILPNQTRPDHTRSHLNLSHKNRPRSLSRPRANTTDSPSSPSPALTQRSSTLGYRSGESAFISYVFFLLLVGWLMEGIQSSAPVELLLVNWFLEMSDVPQREFPPPIADARTPGPTRCRIGSVKHRSYAGTCPTFNSFLSALVLSRRSGILDVTRSRPGFVC